VSTKGLGDGGSSDVASGPDEAGQGVARGRHHTTLPSVTPSPVSAAPAVQGVYRRALVYRGISLCIFSGAREAQRRLLIRNRILNRKGPLLVINLVW